MTADLKDSPRAGRSTRELAGRRYKARINFLLPMVGVLLLLGLLLLYVPPHVSTFGTFGTFIFLGLLAVVRLLMNYTDVREKKMFREERRAVRGAKGEEAIGAILDSLGDDYLIIQDVESRYGNIDHIVIARHAGLFLIETKAHGGKVSVINERLLVNGHRPEKDFIAQALKNTYWLRDRIREATGLQVWITPIIAFTNAFVEPTPAIKNVRIVNIKYLAALLQQPDNSQRHASLWENRQKVQSILRSN